MTKSKFSVAFGARLKRVRKASGFRSTEALAEAIENPAVSASVIRNIENGRKAELSVVHLLELSMACGVSPLVLLVDYMHPYAEVGVPGLGPNFVGMSSIELDEWITMPFVYDPVLYHDELLVKHSDDVQLLSMMRSHNRLRRLRGWRSEAMKKAVRMSKKYGAPYDFEHLRRGLWEVDQELARIARRAEARGVDLDDARKRMYQPDDPAAFREDDDL